MLPYETIREEIIQIVARGSANVVSAFTDTQKHVEAFYRIYYVPKMRIAKAETMNEMRATPVEIVQSKLTTVQMLHGRRIAEHLLDCVRSLNERRLYQLALSTRSVIEVAASLVSTETKVTAMLTKGVTSQAESDALDEVIDKSIRGGRFDWSKWLQDDSRTKLIEAYAEYARGDGKEPKPDIEQTNVLTMVRTFGRKIAEKNSADEGLIQVVYGLLSDICHPAAGGNLLQLINHPNPRWWQLGPGVSDDLLRWYCLHATVPVVARVCDEATNSNNKLTACSSAMGNASGK